MTEELSPYLNLDIPDPTDFPIESNTPGLRSLDEALRCSICRELFEAPVTVNCTHGHCFCSLCIREQMTTKQECPLCRQAILEVHLRRNTTVEDAVKSWKRARSPVLAMLQEKSLPMPATPPALSTNPDVTFSPSNKRKRLSNNSDDEEVVEVAGPSIDGKASIAKPPALGKSGSAMVECPMCNRQVAEQLINPHIDNGCKTITVNTSSKTVSSPHSKRRQKQAWSRLLSSESNTGPSNKGKAKRRAPSEEVDFDFDTAEQIPKMAYDTLSAKVIRERLAEHSLPTDGDKVTLAARHSRWVAMFNANLDASSSERKSMQQLRNELKKWEESYVLEKTRKTRPNNLDLNTYVSEHKTTFARLVEKAGGGRARPRPAASTGKSATQGSPTTPKSSQPIKPEVVKL